MIWNRRDGRAKRLIYNTAEIYSQLGKARPSAPWSTGTNQNCTPFCACNTAPSRISLGLAPVSIWGRIVRSNSGRRRRTSSEENRSWPTGIGLVGHDGRMHYSSTGPDWCLHCRDITLHQTRTLFIRTHDCHHLLCWRVETTTGAEPDGNFEG